MRASVAHTARFFISIVFHIFLLACTVVAQEAVICPGENLLDKYVREKPAEAAAVLAEMKAVPNSGALFWKVQGPKGTKPSWLLGTMHVSDDRITKLSAATRARIKAARVLVLELKELQNRQTLALSIFDFADKVQMPAGQTVWDLIPDDKEGAIKDNPAVKRIPADIVSRFQLWVLASLFEVTICEMERKSSKLTLDETLAQWAQISNVPVEGLETVEEQVSVMSGFSMAEQVEQLLMATDKDAHMDDWFATTVDLYLTRRISAAIPLSKRLIPPSKAGITSDYFLSELIDKRNVTMAARAGPYLDKGNAFIAVGALHLAGEKGPVALLRSAGYLLTPAE